MEDWIWNAANEKGIRDIEIDILNERVEPAALQIEPIITQLPFISLRILVEIILIPVITLILKITEQAKRT